MASTVSAPRPVTATPATSATPISMPVAWAISFLMQMGAPVTPTNIGTVISWGTAESGPPSGGGGAHGGWRNFNPLNVVVQSNDSHVGQGGTQGNIADFGDITTGATAAARLLKQNPNASGIVAALRAGNTPAGTVNSVVNSFYATWGGHINFAGIKPDLSGSPAQTATLTRGFSPLDPTTYPIIGGIFKAGEATAGLAGSFLGLFKNWRYVVEVMAGLGLIGIGILLIAHDTGADRKVIHTAGTAGQTAAGVAAVAA